MAKELENSLFDLEISLVQLSIGTRKMPNLFPRLYGCGGSALREILISSLMPKCVQNEGGLVE
jgi:hypothetical protein